MRVALCVPEYRTVAGTGGGVTSVTDFVADALGNDGMNVEILSLRMSRRAAESRRLLSPASWLRGVQTSETAINGRRVIYVGSSLAELEPARFLPRRALDELVRHYDAIMVIAGTPAPCVALSRVKTPVLLQVATLVKHERKQYLREQPWAFRWHRTLSTWATMLLDRRGLSVPCVTIVENEWMYDYCRRMNVSGLTLQAPGVDLDFFTPAPPEQPHSSNRYVLMVGRLDDPRKNLSMLFRAYAQARQELGLGHRLILAGRTAPRAEDLALLDALSIRDSVEIRTNLGLEELRDLYRGADIFALSSSEEGLGIVLLEAMACGVPVVSTATAGAQHAIGDGDVGEQVAFGEDLNRRFAEAIASLALDDARRIRQGLKARQRAEARFSAASAGHVFAKLVREAIIDAQTVPDNARNDGRMG